MKPRTRTPDEIHEELVASLDPVERARFARTLSAMLDSKGWWEMALQYNLTVRELEIAQFLVCGLTTTEIAAACGCSDTTAKTHQRRLLSKMHVRRRWRLPIKLLLAAGLINGDRQ